MRTGRTSRTGRTGKLGKLGKVFGTVLLDIGVPIGSYYLFKYTLGMSEVAALGWGSVFPALRTVWTAVKERKFNGLAGLILIVNVVSLALTFVTGDARLMIVKDSGVTSAVGLGILVSLFMGRPLMTENAKPWLVRGDSRREAAWDKLQEQQPAFRRAEWRFSFVWGVALFLECVVRIIGAYTLSVDTMVWASNVLMVVSMGLAFLVSGAVGSGPMMHMISAEVRAAKAREAEAGEAEAGVEQAVVEQAVAADRTPQTV